MVCLRIFKNFTVDFAEAVDNNYIGVISLALYTLLENAISHETGLNLQTAIKCLFWANVYGNHRQKVVKLSIDIKIGHTNIICL